MYVYEVKIGDGITRDAFFVTARNWKEASQKAWEQVKSYIDSDGWDVMSVSRHGEIR